MIVAPLGSYTTRFEYAVLVVLSLHCPSPAMEPPIGQFIPWVPDELGARCHLIVDEPVWDMDQPSKLSAIVPLRMQCPDIVGHDFGADARMHLAHAVIPFEEAV